MPEETIENVVVNGIVSYVMKGIEGADMAGGTMRREISARCMNGGE